MTDLDEIDLEPEDFDSSVPLKKVPYGDVFEAARAGDVDRLRYLLETGVNVNARDQWDSAALYYACLAGHLEAARMLLEGGAICSEHTFDGDRCHYAALNLKVRKLLKAFEARPPPLGPLQSSLRDTFLGCAANVRGNDTLGCNCNHFPPDVVFYLQGKAIEAHRVILSARSPFFKEKFQTVWKDRKEVRFSKERLSYPALYSLIHFFYSDRLEVAVDDMEDLITICRVVGCHDSLINVLEKELVLQRHVDYKSLRDVDSSQRRYILQGLSLPEEARLSTALNKTLLRGEGDDDLADVCVRVEGKVFRCHQVILASRSEYFKARLSRMKGFQEDDLRYTTLLCIEEHDLSSAAFEKMVEYMYTDGLKDIDPDQAGELFDAASRYLLFPLKRAVADALLPHLEMATPAELCHLLVLSEMYGVFKIREYCLDAMARNFETFSETSEFRAMLLTLPPPSGDSTFRTSAPNAPGVETREGGNVLDDLREKWLEAKAADLDKRDESALLFDKRLQMLMHSS